MQILCRPDGAVHVGFELVKIFLGKFTVATQIRLQLRNIDQKLLIKLFHLIQMLQQHCFLLIGQIRHLFNQGLGFVHHRQIFVNNFLRLIKQFQLLRIADRTLGDADLLFQYFQSIIQIAESRIQSRTADISQIFPGSR